MRKKEISGKETPENLAKCITGGTLGILAGIVSAWIYPKLGYDAGKNLLTDGVQSLHWYVGRVSLILGETYQLSNFVRDIAENPSDWRSYIPFATASVGTFVMNAANSFIQRRNSYRELTRRFGHCRN